MRRKGEGLVVRQTVWALAAATAVILGAGAAWGEPVSIYGDAQSDDLPLALSAFGNATCANPDCVAVSGSGTANGTAGAVSGLGNAQSGCRQIFCSAISGSGDAASDCHTCMGAAVSLLGDSAMTGCGQALPCLAASTAGSATADCRPQIECLGMAVSVLGDASALGCYNGTCYAVSGVGDSHGDYAATATGDSHGAFSVSGTGDASGDLLVISLTGSASCTQSGFCWSLDGCDVLSFAGQTELCNATVLPPL